MFKSMIIGNLAADAERKDIGRDGAVKFTVAVNNPRKRDDKPTYVGCTLWGTRGAKLLPYLVKGQKVFADGDFTVSKSDQGNTFFDLNINELVFVGERKERGKTPPSQGGGDDYNPASTGDMDDEIPF